MVLKNIRYILIHKWYVFLECCKLGIPWLGIIHDFSKLMPDEFFPYARFFYGKRNMANKVTFVKPMSTGDPRFDFAWLLHQKRNKHHWQWWVLPEDSGSVKVIPMADKYRREMLADWRGAGRSQGFGDNTRSWYIAHCDQMNLHPETRRWIESQLGLSGRHPCSHLR